jgi:predicted alpha/beta-fold hydrolase
VQDVAHAGRLSLLDARAFFEEMALAALGIGPLAVIPGIEFRPADDRHSTSAHATIPGSALSAGRFWEAIGPLEPRRRGGRDESAFRSTMRVARGDLKRRYSDQDPVRAGREPLDGAGNWPEYAPGFSRIVADDTGRAPLRAFFHPPRPAHPIIVLVHGLFDSKLSRYIRIVAESFAAGGFGVLVPDMRWHGELLTREWLVTLGLAEGPDLVGWGAWLQRMKPQPASGSRPRDDSSHVLGLVGFSLGALDAIHALAHPRAAEVFRAGGIVFSPPADLETTRPVLDTPATLREFGMEAAVIDFFQRALSLRMKELHAFPEARARPRAPELFSRFLDWLAPLLNSTGEQVSAPAPGSEPSPSTPRSMTADGLLRLADPRHALPACRRPLLVVCSSHDPVYRTPTAPDLAASSAGNGWVRVVETPAGGHIGHIGRYPEWCAGLFGRFFSLSGSVDDARGTIS